MCSNEHLNTCRWVVVIAVQRVYLYSGGEKKAGTRLKYAEPLVPSLFSSPLLVSKDKSTHIIPQKKKIKH